MFDRISKASSMRLGGELPFVFIFSPAFSAFFVFLFMLFLLSHFRKILDLRKVQELSRRKDLSRGRMLSFS